MGALLSVWAFILAATPGFAAGEPPALPAAMVMPFRVLSIDTEELARSRPALDAAITTLANGFLTGPRPLSTLLPQSPRLTVNFRRRAEKIITGKPKTDGTVASAAVEATWCSLMDHHVFFVTVADAVTNTLLGSRHVAISRKEWQKLEARKGQATFLDGKLPTLLRDAWAEAKTRAQRPKTENMNVGLYQGEASTRGDEGSGFCPTQLLEEKLAPDYTVARSLGLEYLAMARDLFELPPRLTRPTRGVILSFRQRNQLEPLRALPVTLDLTTLFAETVYGQHLAQEPAKSTVQIAAAPGGTLSLTGIDALKKTLDAEKATLLLADQPQAAKIDRAWVYLDRGRAFGLKMNDRVVAEVDGQPVKGHVVKFFGPELNIKSPRGYPIREGAIVYVRKGQKLAKVGMTFTPDKRTYPTPYPITPAK